MHIGRKAKRAIIALLVFAFLLLMAHLLVRWRSKQIINFIVQEVSGGQYYIQSDRVRIHYFPFRVNSSKIGLFPADSSGNNYYTAAADSFYLELANVWSLISENDFSIKKVHIVNLQVNAWNRDTTKPMKPFHLAVNDIQDALVQSLSAFKVEQCNIRNAAISYTGGKQNELPLFINHINLDIDSLRAVKKIVGVDTTVDFSTNIRLAINRPNIQLPDTSIQLNVETLLIDSRKDLFSVTSFKILARNSAGTLDSVALSNINLRQLNWSRFLQDGSIEIQSLQANNGATAFDFSDRELFDISNKKQVVFKKTIRIPVIVHQAEINKIQYNLKTNASSGPVALQLKADSLSITDMELGTDSLRPFSIANLAFNVSDYIYSHDDNSGTSKFERLIISNKDLELRNYYRSLAGENFGKNNSIFIPVLRVENFSLPALMQYQLKADKLILEQPRLVIDIQQSQKKKDADENVARILKSLQPNLDISSLSIREATIDLLPKAKATGKIAIENLSTEIDARQLLGSRTVMEMIESATALSTTGFTLTSDNMNLEIRRSALSKDRNGISLEHLKGNIGDEVELDLFGVSLSDKSGKFDVTKLETIELSNVKVDSGIIKVQVHANKNRAGTAKPMPAFVLHNVSTGNTRLIVAYKDSRLDIRNIDMQGRNFFIDRGLANWEQLRISSGFAEWNTPGYIVNTSGLKLAQPGNLQAGNIHFIPADSSRLKKLFIPALSIQTNIPGSNFKNMQASNLVVHQPLIELNFSSHDTAKAKPVVMPGFSLNSITIKDPKLTCFFNGPGLPVQLHADTGSIQLKNVIASNSENNLSVAKMDVDLRSPVVHIENNSWQPAQLKINSRDLLLANQPRSFSALLDSLQVMRVTFNLSQPGDIKVSNASAGIAGFHYFSTDSFDIKKIIRDADWWANANAISNVSKQHRTTVFNPRISSVPANIFIDSVWIDPLVTREVFWSKYPFEKDFIKLKTGPLQFFDYKVQGEGNQRKLSARKMNISDADLLIERDKRRGVDSVKYRPLLAASLQAIPLRFNLDTVHVANGYIRNNIISDKSKQEGTILFTGMQGDITTVKNDDLKKADTLRFYMRSKLMGKGDMLVGFKQPYIDSIQQFKIEARMGAMDLSELNPLLLPLLSVKIDRGLADSMNLNVVGNDNNAYGYMDLQYHNLRVSLIRKGENEYFLSKFYNWAINVLVRSNTSQKGKLLYIERLQNKAVFNFWAKIAIRGLLTNIGIRLARKEVRKYKKALEDKKIPEMEEIL